ncbi:MAG: RagB/SusD family nutrient uptake outer membrane protein [Bacteroidota bacterium]
MKLKFILTIAIFLCMVVGCDDDYLTEKPTTNLSSANIFESQSSAKLALLGVYTTLASDSFYEMLDWLTTDEHSTPSWSPRDGVGNYVLASSSAQVKNYWSDAYRLIARANLLLSGIDEVPMDQSLIDKYKAEALFLRSLKYFDLIRYFGDVPMKLVPDNASNREEFTPTRTSIDVIYDQIIPDLEWALAHLGERFESVGGESYEEGRVTKGAVRMLLAKIYLRRASMAKIGKGNGDVMADYQKCIDYCKDVIFSGTYSLVPYFPDVFRNESNEEVIFEVNFLGGQDPSLGHRQYQWKGIQSIGANPISEPNWGVWPESNVTRRVARSFFPEGDSVRLNWTTTNLQVRRVNGQPTLRGNNAFAHFSAKWRNVPVREQINAHWDDGRNIVIYRLADAHLMLAEAENEFFGSPTQEAMDAVNALRKRASNVNVGSVHEDVVPRVLTETESVPALMMGEYDYASFNEYIYLERTRELCNEGHRYFDLQRWGRLVESIKASGSAPYVNWFYIAWQNVQEFHNLLPIPQFEIDGNPNLTQNPGY